MQAAWQALQPMQREMSMSLATSSVERAEGPWEVLAERALMSSDCRGMASSSGLLDVDEERLVLGRLDVGVPDRGGERVHHVPLAGEPVEAPVEGDADGVHLLALDGQRPDALGDQGLELDLAALGPHHHHVAAL